MVEMNMTEFIAMDEVVSFCHGGMEDKSYITVIGVSAPGAGPRLSQEFTNENKFCAGNPKLNVGSNSKKKG